jgi:6-phosphogluconolactonase
MSNVFIFPDIEHLEQAVLDEIITAGKKTIRAENRFSIVLSGGSTPRGVYSLLAQIQETDLDWSMVHFFWGDERCVPPDHPDSNYKMAQEVLLRKIPVPDSNIHRMSGEKHPIAAADLYQQELESFFTDNPKFNMVLLGMGSDGHTASLFPGSDAIMEQNRWVSASYITHLKAWRITLTPIVINQAEHIVFMVSGEDKAHTLQRVLDGAYEPDLLPAQVIQPKKGTLSWMIDQQAAAHLHLR